jgi:hypothetical protein
MLPVFALVVIVLVAVVVFVVIIVVVRLRRLWVRAGRRRFGRWRRRLRFRLRVWARLRRGRRGGFWPWRHIALGQQRQAPTAAL